MEYDKETAKKRRDYYLWKAKEAEDKAAFCTDDATRRTWQDIAQSWRFLAEHMMRNPEG